MVGEGLRSMERSEAAQTSQTRLANQASHACNPRHFKASVLLFALGVERNPRCYKMLRFKSRFSMKSPLRIAGRTVAIPS